MKFHPSPNLLSVSQLPIFERPRERCLADGPEVLSLRECLAVLLGSAPRQNGGCLGVAESILDRAFPADADGRVHEEHRERAFFETCAMGPESLFTGLPGLGEAGRARLLVALELGRRLANHRLYKQLSARPSRHDEARLHGCFGLDLRLDPALRTSEKEWIGFFPVYDRGEPGEFCLVERGVRTHVNLDPAELFQRILSLRARAFILAHNHPSGDPHPSACDQDLTFRVRSTAETLGLKLLGHWIVVADGPGSRIS